jgi:hypothetical protein
MPKDVSVSSLYRIEECADLMADACLCDDDRRLTFASIWGRDTAVQEFLARLTLVAGDHSLDHFHLLTDEHVSIPVFVGDTDRLEKRQTRALRRTLFGSLLNVWLIDKRCLTPDKANGTALALLPKVTTDSSQRLWRLVQDTCSLPLLDHWRDSVLEVLRAKSMLTPLSFALGPLAGFRLVIDLPALSWTLGEAIRSGTLTINPGETTLSAIEGRRAA